MAEMVAVTIAIGSEHESLAEIAAERMRCHTGLPVKILGADDLARTEWSHPTQLKFRLFDLVAAENILFFDADVFCQRPWNPREFADRKEWVAVRGWWFDPWVQRFGGVYGFGDDVFNVGFFICNRTHHLSVLRLAESVQRVRSNYHGLASLDELALNTARAALGIPVHFLDRRFNWIQHGRGHLSDLADVVLAHACDAQLRQRFLCSFGVAPSIGQASCAATEFNEATYIYDRIGYDERPMTFRSDGTIGKGGGDAERFWFVRPDAGEPTLTIGSVYDETCALTKHSDGIWRGRWNDYERMPIRLIRHRAQVLIDLLTRLRGRTADLIGAEVGVCTGETSELLLKGLPNLHLFLVDPWRTPTPGTDYWKTGAGDSTMTQSMFDDVLERAAIRTAFAAHRRTIVLCESAEAAAFLPAELDFVFIDGDHSYSGVMRDLETCWPRVAKSGVLTGHDYGNPNFPDVKRAVDEFAASHGLSVRQGSDSVWFYDNVVVETDTKLPRSRLDTPAQNEALFVEPQKPDTRQKAMRELNPCCQHDEPNPSTTGFVLNEKVTDCTCQEPGWCERHRCFKPDFLFELCRRRRDFFDRWEQGQGIGQSESSVAPPKPRTDCQHLGEMIDEVPCQTCQGSVRLKVFVCTLHFRCTQGRVHGDFACCATCSDYCSVS